MLTMAKRVESALCSEQCRRFFYIGRKSRTLAQLPYMIQGNYSQIEWSVIRIGQGKRQLFQSR